jgi:HEPN domain-containing protein
MTDDSSEWFRQAQYDLGTAESLLTTGRNPPVIFFCHLAIEKALKALYVEKFDESPERTHSLVYLVEILELELPQHLLEALFVINRIGITAAIPTIFPNLLNNTHRQRQKRSFFRQRRSSHG